jgi:hypothetical protein
LTLPRPAYPLAACNTAYLAFDSFYPIGVSASALLFFFRVRAVYSGDRIVSAVFGFLWLAVLGSSITIPVGAGATSFGDPAVCIATRIEPYVGSSGIVLTVYDTLVFVAISYRLVSNFEGMQKQTRWERLTSLFTGANLPAFSKALLTDGQVYYLCVPIYFFLLRR